MKKVLLPICAMLLCMTACQKEENNGILTLEVEHYTSNAKVHIDDDNYAVWDNNDQVKVNGNDYSINVIENGSNSTATISGVPEANSYYAIYPAAWATGNTTLNIPGMQTYRENTTSGNQIVDAPMFAYSDGGTLKFRNLGALLAVNVNNQTGSDLTVVTIDVTAQGAALCGSATISNPTSEEPSLSVTGHNTVTLYCNTTIAANGSKEFYISLPPITTSELTITVNDATQGHTKTRTSTTTLARNAGQRVEFSTSDATVVDHSGPLPNQIWYKATKSRTDRFAINGYGANYVADSYTNSTSWAVVTFDGPIATIPAGAFHFSENARTGYLKSFTLPANVTTIGDEAFMDLSRLESAIMPGVASLGKDAISGCPMLTSISLPCLLHLGENAFRGSALKSASFPNLISVGNYAFYGCGSLTSVSLPKATTVGEDAFKDCTALESVSIPNVTQIGSWGFDGCSSLTTVYADNVANLGAAAFQGCSSLANFYSNTAEPTINGSYVFFQVPSTAVLHLPTSCQATANWNNWPGTISYE